MSEPLVLIVGAADTGRAPMAAALLGRMLAAHGLGLRVASAGVVGHDGDPAEPEARSAMLALGLELDGHLARSLSDELAGEATVLVAVASGVAHVVRARHPDATVVTLGELAGRARDLPDPFRMQLGAWLQYAGEIEALLRAGLPRLRSLVEGQLPVAPEPAAAPQPAPDEGRRAAVERAVRLLSLAAELPGVIDWPAARAQLALELAVLEVAQADDDLARPYVALLRARLPADGPPAPAVAQALAAAVGRLRSPILAADLQALTYL